MFKTYSLFLVLSIVALAGCKKDEISRTKDNLTRSWATSKVEIGGADSTAYWEHTHANYSIQFTKTGTFVESFTDEYGDAASMSGEWTLSSDAIQLTLTTASKKPARVYNLILVDDDNLNFSRVNSSPKETYYFKSN